MELEAFVPRLRRASQSGNGLAPPIFVVSGGAGASGDLLVQTLLAQFTDVHVAVTVWGDIHTVDQIAPIVAKAATEQALIVHTLVERELCQALILAAKACAVPEVDLVGELMAGLSHHLAQPPLGKPGRYRALRNGYFRRIDAIEFAVQHDDGQRLHELEQAEIVILGISRVGKTPLSVYLSLEGWKVANVPIVPGIALTGEISRVTPARVVGLTIAPAQLLHFRRARQSQLGIDEGSYFDLTRIGEEVRAANHLFGQLGCAVIDVTDKPIETTSEEVVAEVRARLATAP